MTDYLTPADLEALFLAIDAQAGPQVIHIREPADIIGLSPRYRGIGGLLDVFAEPSRNCRCQVVRSNIRHIDTPKPKGKRAKRRSKGKART